MMFLFAFLSFALSPRDLINDPNIVLESNGTFAVKYNVAAYDSKSNGKWVETKDKRQIYYYANSIKEGVLYTIRRNEDATFDSSRYLVQNGLVKSITKCETESYNYLISKKDKHTCHYMDHDSCRSFLAKAKRLQLQRDECNDWLKEVRLALPSDKRYLARAESAIQGVQELFANESINGWGLNISFGESYRAITREDLKNSQFDQAMQLMTAFDRSVELCSRLNEQQTSNPSQPQKAIN